MILKELCWVGTSKRDLKNMPMAVQRDVGFSLHQAQEGKMALNAKPLKEIGAGVIEIVSDYNKNTYRAVYVVKLGDVIYVLHSFQKKSKTGIKTPKQDIDLIKRRLALAREDAISRNK